MTYQEFVDGITELAAKSGENVTVVFNQDVESGKYTGISSNGIRFSGNSHSFKVTVNWGHKHQAQFSVA